MNIPPPILQNFYNQGGDDDADDHEHEDPYRSTQWRLATYSDGSPRLVCIQAPLMLLRKQVLSPMVALSGSIPTSVVGYSGWILLC